MKLLSTAIMTVFLIGMVPELEAQFGRSKQGSSHKTARVHKPAQPKKPKAVKPKREPKKVEPKPVKPKPKKEEQKKEKAPSKPKGADKSKVKEAKKDSATPKGTANDAKKNGNEPAKPKEMTHDEKVAARKAKMNEPLGLKEGTKVAVKKVDPKNAKLSSEVAKAPSEVKENTTANRDKSLGVKEGTKVAVNKIDDKKAVINPTVVGAVPPAADQKTPADKPKTKLGKVIDGAQGLYSNQMAQGAFGMLKDKYEKDQQTIKDAREKAAQDAKDAAAAKLEQQKAAQQQAIENAKAQQEHNQQSQQSTYVDPNQVQQ